MRNISPIGTAESDRSNAAMRDLLYFFMLGLLAFAYFSISTSALRDGDTSWHLAAGKWIFAHGAIPTTDPFSYTFLGKPWTAHEWLSEILMFAAYSAGGWTGLLLMFGAVSGLTFVTLAHYVRRWLSFPLALVPLFLSFVGTINHSLARPHLFGWLLLALWMTSLLRARDAARAPSLWTATLMILWANLHGSFVLGLALIAPLALEALWEAGPTDRGRAFLDWTVFGLVSLLASLMTPQGLEGLIFPIKVSMMTALNHIGEWMPTAFGAIGAFEVVLLSGIFICLYKPVKVPLIRLLLIIGLLHLAFAHIRHQAVFVILSCFLLARPFALALESEGREKPGPFLLSDLGLRQIWPILAVMAALLGGVGMASFSFARERPDTYGVPQAAIDHIPADLRARPVFNEYSFGGTLILNTIPVFIDGRNDVYGDAFLDNYIEIVRGGDFEKWEAIQKKWKIEWVIMPPDKGLVTYLDHQSGWVRIYADKWAVIHALKSRATVGPQPSATDLRTD